jgi:hypothetical protein
MDDYFKSIDSHFQVFILDHHLNRIQPIVRHLEEALLIVFSVLVGVGMTCMSGKHDQGEKHGRYG